MKIALALFLMVAQLQVVAHAIEVDVRYEEKVYYLHAKFEVQAPPARVMEILTDYNNISELNPAIIESKILSSESVSPDVVRVQTVIRDCIIFICRNITRVQDIQQQGVERLDSVIIPELSDLQSGHSIWELVENGRHTHVQYISTMQFKFWVPPFIRSNTITKKFKKRIMQATEQLQKLAEGT